MNKKNKNRILTILGFAILVTGLCLIKTLHESTSALPYICIGCGCGIFGHGAGELMSIYAEKKAPEEARKREIAENDERNISLRNRAQAKAYNIMLTVFGALFMAFALMGVEAKVVLLLVAAYLFVCGCSIYYRIKYEKEM